MPLCCCRSGGPGAAQRLQPQGVPVVAQPPLVRAPVRAARREEVPEAGRVVEHEVVHLEVLDHSQRFWILLAERVPTWREHELWLRHHGHALRL